MFAIGAGRRSLTSDFAEQAAPSALANGTSPPASTLQVADLVLDPMRPLEAK
jgi:hypothetical protein